MLTDQLIVDYFAFHCDMKVVLCNAELMRTRMVASKDPTTEHGSANTWQLFPCGYGPSLDGIFIQSNYGTVTKMGCKLSWFCQLFGPQLAAQY